MPNYKKSVSIASLANLLAVPELPKYLVSVNRQMETMAGSDVPALKKPLQKLLKHSGKQLRPALLLATAASQKRKIDQSTINLAACIELMHVSSLIHDDIIDNADSRHGQPTISKQEGKETALLAGDYLFSVACSEAAQISGQAAHILSYAFSRMTEGQSLELIDNLNENRTLGNYLATITAKSGALMSAACQLGAIYVQASPTTVQAFATYGEAFGILFQLIDDLLDIVAEPASYGKPIGNDIREGTYTLPVILALQSSQKSEMLKYLHRADKTDHNLLIGLLNRSGALDKCMESVRTYESTAKSALAALPPNPITSGLMQLPGTYISQALSGTVLGL